MALSRRVRRYAKVLQQRGVVGFVPLCGLLLVVFVAPLRNMLVPGWPHVYRDMSTFKVLSFYKASVRNRIGITLRIEYIEKQQKQWFRQLQGMELNQFPTNGYNRMKSGYRDR